MLKVLLFSGFPMDDGQRFDQRRYKHWIEDHVRFSDLDPLGHVNNNAIGEYFENARAALFIDVTPNWPHRDHIFILAHSAIDFRHELHMPAQLRIGSCITSLGRTSMKLSNALFRGDHGVAYCENVSVLIDRTTRKPVPISDELRQVLTKYIAT
jgi:acyl-CoA thioester hydrolase